jgi:hypothetical protein
MGNGFTFPLQTVWYLAAVTAVYRISGRNPETRICDPVTALPIREIGVFGDDIILASDLAPVLISFLEEVGFVVNVEKSHYSRDGLFRESCGADWYRGNFVRGTYFKSFNTDADRVISFNQILLWSLEHSIPMKRTLSALKNGIPPWRKNRVPFYEQDDAGLKQPGNSYPRGVLKGLGCFSYESDYIYRAFRPVKRIREVFPRVAPDPTDHVVVELSARCESITQETQFPRLHGKEPKKPSTYFVGYETACFFQKFVSVGLIDDRIVSVRSPAYAPVRYREEYVAVPSMTAPPARIKGSRAGISIDTTSPELVWSRHGSWSALISAYQRIYGIW